MTSGAGGTITIKIVHVDTQETITSDGSITVLHNQRTDYSVFQRHFFRFTLNQFLFLKMLEFTMDF